MIGKVPKAGRGFQGLMRYLMHGEKGASERDRVAWTSTRNLLTNDPERAVRMMRATASRNKRVQTPVYHYVISWAVDENPTDELMLFVADATCADLNLTEYQAVYIAHRDTQHRHLHIVVNRVHPETGKAWNRRQDWPVIERSLRRQAELLGLEYVPGRHNDPERFKGRPRRQKDADYQAERRGARSPSPGRWSNDRIELERKRLVPIFEKARSWDDVHADLAGIGLTLQKKGQGVVLADDTGMMKLSELSKSIRLVSLRQRFGLEKVARTLEDEPVQAKKVRRRRRWRERER